MEVIFLIGTIQCFFLTILIFGKKNRKQADIFLAFWFIGIGLLLLDNYFRNTGFIGKFPHAMGITYCIPMLIGPFIFIYAILLINKNARFKKIYYLHAIPFVIFVTYFLINFYFLNASEKLEYFNEMAREPVFMIYAVEFFIIFSSPIYTVLILIFLRKHSKNIKNSFSYTEKINLTWLKLILICKIVLAFLSLATNLLSDVFPVIPYWVGDNIIFTGITILVFFMGYYGIKQPVIYKGISLEEARETIKHHALIEQDLQNQNKIKDIGINKEKYKSSGLKSDEAEKYLKILLEYVEKEKPYFESKLTLKDVSESIGVSSNHISQVINEKLNVNFFDFINNYRIEEVKKCFSDPKFNHYTLLGIAFECGFNSKSSFNSIFKKATSLTPSEFQKSILV
ncbi:helix-turn-helix domain-containing protein [Bacteroidota bacterium]